MMLNTSLLVGGQAPNCLRFAHLVNPYLPLPQAIILSEILRAAFVMALWHTATGVQNFI